MFVGRFVRHADRASLEGSFTLHPAVRWFMRLWFSFLLLFVALVATRIATHPRMGEELLLLAIPLVLIPFGVLLLRMGRRVGLADVSYIDSAVSLAPGGRLDAGGPPPRPPRAGSGGGSAGRAAR